MVDTLSSCAQGERPVTADFSAVAVGQWWEMRAIAALIWAVVLIFFTHTATAEIYKWVDGQGTIHFTDSPPEQARVEKLELQINSFPSPEISTFVFNDKLITSRKAGKKVIMYGASWCGVCKSAKDYFAKNNIRYVDYDVETSAKGKKDYKQLKGKGVPVILVGNRRLNGFSAASFEQIYGR